MLSLELWQYCMLPVEKPSCTNWNEENWEIVINYNYIVIKNRAEKEDFFSDVGPTKYSSEVLSY